MRILLRFLVVFFILAVGTGTANSAENILIGFTPRLPEHRQRKELFKLKPSSWRLNRLMLPVVLTGKKSI